MISSRVAATTGVNALTRQVESLRARGIPFVDLTESNPTTVGLPYPPGLLDTLSGSRALRYEPHALGLRDARAAVAADAWRRGVALDPAHVVLTASTSEAYGWLFKLLCDCGDVVAVPRPSYPLFEHLTRLEGVEMFPYDLDYHGHWSIDVQSVLAAPHRTKALVVVSPNNPTGSYVSRDEFHRLDAICRDRGWALIADEVFSDYVLEASEPVRDLSSRASALTFTLGGASKMLGLPQVKLGWMVVGGEAAARDAALGALELIADTYLSVSTPVQMACPSLLRDAASVRDGIHARIRANLAGARAVLPEFPSCDLLRVEGGWAAVVRVPATQGEEALVNTLLERERILVHPGYFFDFPHEAFLVLSLLPPEDVFRDGLRRVLTHATR